jgi:UDP-glucuronate decarboxylase
MGAINTLGLAKRVKAKILQAVPVRCMVILRFIRNRRPIGKCNLLVSVLAMTKGNVVQRLVHGYHNQNQVNIKIIRIFYRDPPMNPADGRVVSNFLSFGLKGRYYYFGDGLQTRSFQYVDDLVEGMIRMMN